MRIGPRWSLPVVLTALVLAGCTDSSAPSSSSTPTDAASASTDRVEGTLQQRDFQMSYRLDGTTVDGQDVLLDVRDGLDLQPAPGIGSGVTVSEGQLIGVARLSDERAAVLEEGALTSRMDAASLASLRSFEGEVVAPATGVLDLDSAVPVVSHPGIDVVTPLTPLQSLRYASTPFDGVATVETVVGQRDVTCTSVWVTPGADGVERSLHCRLPAQAETTAGLRAQVALSSQVVPDAVVAPLLFLDYDESADGYILHVREGDAVVTYPVIAGPTDGVVRIVETEAPVGSILVMP